MDILNKNTQNSEQTAFSHNPDSPVVVALDIGTTKIATIVGVKNKHGKIEILAYANVPSKGVLRGAVANIKDATESIARSVNEAASKCSVEVAEVVVGVAGQYVHSQNQSTSLTITHDEVHEDDIKKMIEDIRQISTKAGEKIISVIPQDFTIDGVSDITNPIGYSGKHIKGNFHVVSVGESIIKNINKCVTANNLTVQEFFLESIASAASVLTEEQKESGVCLIDIGGGTTDLAIYYDNLIRYSAVIPAGGDIITDDIKQVCKLTEKQAELLKTEHGYAMPYDDLKNKILKIKNPIDNFLDKTEQTKTINAYHLSEVINYRLQEIIRLVEYHLEASGYRDKIASGIVLTGGGSLLKKIQYAFMNMLGIEVGIGIPNQHIATSIQELKSPLYSTAIGLLILGFENLSESETNNNTPHSKENQSSTNLTDQVTNLNAKRKNIFSNLFKSIKEIFESPDDNLESPDNNQNNEK